MKKLFICLCLLLLGTVLTVAKTAPEEPEIVIELTGKADTHYPPVSVWQKNEKQLTRLFKGKDRTFVLYSIDVVSSADTVLTDADGKKYFFVRYGQEGSNYRKFLFDENEQFLAVADKVETVLKINQKYGVNMGVSEADFLAHFQKNAVLTNLSDFPHQTDYQVYQLPFDGKTAFFVFSNKKLQKIYDDETAFDEYVTALSKQNKEYLDKRKEQERLQVQKQQQAAAERQQNQVPPRKALISGGTEDDRLYLPRALNKKPIPALAPSQIPAGTPVTKYDKNGFPIY